MNMPPQSRSGREIFEAIVLGKEWDFTDAEFESAVLDRQHTYPVLTQKGIDASGATVDVAVSNILPINGSDFSGEIRNMLAALAQRIRETQPTMSQFASKADYERAVADASENRAIESSPSEIPNSSFDKYGKLKLLHEAIRRLAPQFKTEFPPQAWDEIPSEEKDCVAAALEECFPQGAQERFGGWVQEVEPGKFRSAPSSERASDPVLHEIEEALWALHSYESNRGDAGRSYSEAEITKMVSAIRALAPTSATSAHIPMSRDLVIAMRTYVALKRDKQDAMGLDHGATDLLLSRIDAALAGSSEGRDA